MAFREFFQWFDKTAMNLQLPTVTNKLYENEVTLSEQNLFFRPFHTFNIGSEGQGAVKLLADKVGGLKKKSAIAAKVCVRAFGPG